MRKSFQHSRFRMNRRLQPLIQYLKKINLEDAFVLSDQPELVKKAREAYPIIRGIIEYPDVCLIE